MSMRLKESTQKKHVHSWARLGDSPFSSRIERKCSECDLVQSATKDEYILDGVPESLLHLADLDWTQP